MIPLKAAVESKRLKPVWQLITLILTLINAGDLGKHTSFKAHKSKKLTLRRFNGILWIQYDEAIGLTVKAALGKW